MAMDFKIFNIKDEHLFQENLKLAKKNISILQNGTGKGNEFLGWINLPQSTTKTYLSEINNVAEEYSKMDIVIVIGIGGSYLGAKAVIEALKPQFKKSSPEIIFAGHTLSEDYYSELLEYIKGKDFAIVVISKSGTTTEPAIAFSLLLNEMKKEYGSEIIKNRIIAITDEKKGALKTIAIKEGYRTFVIPDNVGGRFSVLSAVGLVPIAIAGFNIEKLIEGACLAQKNCTSSDLEKNISIKYAAYRNYLYNLGKKIEILVNYNMRLNYFAEWWKQLYGESEGKENKGIFPVSASFTTDLHSLGQYIQQGERTIFETILLIKNNKEKVQIISNDKENLDQLNYIAGKNIEFVNKKAFEGTLMAHLDGGIPCSTIILDYLEEFNLGYLIYFFEFACGLSAYILGVNPFDQPGVENYKRNMFKLLGK